MRQYGFRSPILQIEFATKNYRQELFALGVAIAKCVLILHLTHASCCASTWRSDGQFGTTSARMSYKNRQLRFREFVFEPALVGGRRRYRQQRVACYINVIGLLSSRTDV